MGRPSGWMTMLTGRPAMRSPGRPPIRRDLERAFWGHIAEELTWWGHLTLTNSTMHGLVHCGVPAFADSSIAVVLRLIKAALTAQHSTVADTPTSLVSVVFTRDQVAAVTRRIDVGMVVVYER
jgi:hypothetical protein